MLAHEVIQAASWASPLAAGSAVVESEIKAGFCQTLISPGLNRLQNVHVPAVTFYRNDAPRYIGAKNLCAKILKAAGQIATRRRRTDV